jgi:hypothetical protein
MWTTKFWKDLAERIISSAAGGALAILLTGSTDWVKILAGAGIAALVSLLKGLIASQKGDPTSPSLVQ